MCNTHISPTFVLKSLCLVSIHTVRSFIVFPTRVTNRLENCKCFPPFHLISSFCPSLFNWPSARQEKERKGNACMCFPHRFSPSYVGSYSLCHHHIDYNQWNDYKLTLSFLFCLSFITLLSSYQPLPLPTCQPIVFVSDRARANKEIEHDGIRGEKKKKPKVLSLFRKHGLYK